MKTKLAFLLFFFAALDGSARAQVNNARMLSTPNAQTGTTYTFVPADTTRITTFNNAGAVAVTLPNGASLGFGPGTVLSVADLGAGAVTITCSVCTISGAGTLILTTGQGADLYGGAGTPPVNYVAMLGAGGSTGSITGCGTAGGMIYQNGAPNMGTCSPSVVETPAATGPDSAAFSVNVTSATAFAGLFSNFGTITSPAFDQVGAEGETSVTLNSPNTDSSDVFGLIGAVAATGTGTFGSFSFLAGLGTQSEYDGTGTVTNLVGNYAGVGVNTNGGTIVNNNGFYTDDQSNIGTNNYDYFAPATTAGAGKNYQFFAALGGTSQFDLVNLTAGLNLGAAPGVMLASVTAPAIAGGGCGGSGASVATKNGTAAFKVNVGTLNTGTCTVTMPAATTDWLCAATDKTTTSANVFVTKSVPGGSPMTQVTLQNYTDLAATHAWVDGDVIGVICTGE